VELPNAIMSIPKNSLLPPLAHLASRFASTAGMIAKRRNNIVPTAPPLALLLYPNPGGSNKRLFCTPRK
jgi:hypothetical protein